MNGTEPRLSFWDHVVLRKIRISVIVDYSFKYFSLLRDKGFAGGDSCSYHLNFPDLIKEWLLRTPRRSGKRHLSKNYWKSWILECKWGQCFLVLVLQISYPKAVALDWLSLFEIQRLIGICLGEMKPFVRDSEIFKKSVAVCCRWNLIQWRVSRQLWKNVR